MRIDILKDSGFCGGVNRALFLLDKTIKENQNKKIYLLGPIVHNTIVNNKYENLGIKIISLNDLSKINKDSIIVISAHGLSDKSKKLLEGFKIVDTTCPFVKKNQLLLKNEEKEEIIFIGKKDHSETRALTEDRNNIKIIETIEDLNKFNSNYEGAVYNQTTVNKNTLSDIHKIIQEKAPLYEIHNTMCETQLNIQKFLEEPNPKYNVCIVVGDKMSNNANSLVKMSPYEKTYFIEGLEGIHDIKLTEYDNIVIIGSASTPKNLLIDVKKRINDLSMFLID